MSKLIVNILIFVSLTVVIVDSQTLGTIDNSEKPDKLGYCFDDELNEYYPNGTNQLRKGLCQQVRCFKSEHGPGLTLRKEGCAIASVSCADFVIIAEDLSKPYPACCQQIICP